MPPALDWSQDVQRSAPPGPGDEVTVTRIDRLARSTFDLFAIVKQIVDAGGQFQSLAEPWADTATSTGRLMIAVLGGLADVERDLIRTRAAEGRSRAKARGQHMGRPPKLTPQQQKEARRRARHSRPEIFAGASPDRTRNHPLATHQSDSATPRCGRSAWRSARRQWRRAMGSRPDRPARLQAADCSIPRPITARRPGVEWNGSRRRPWLGSPVVRRSPSGQSCRFLSRADGECPPRAV
jgi:hypothetical protein